MLVVVPLEHVAVVERRGKHHRVLEPGVRLLVPGMDHVAGRVDLRPREQHVAPFEASDRLGTPVVVGLRLTWRVKDPVAATYEITNLPAGLDQLAVASARGFLAGTTADEVDGGDGMAEHLGWVLGEAGVRWGIAVLSVDVVLRGRGPDLPHQ